MRVLLVHVLSIVVMTSVAVAGESEPLTLTCVGQVVDACDHPVSGATVTAHERFWPLNWHVAAPFNRTTTDTDGRFVLTADRKRPKGGWVAQLVATRHGHAIGWSSSWWILRQDHETVIRLGRAASFEGIVVDEAGSPVSGAEVRLCLTLGKGPLSPSIVGTSQLNELAARTDGQGKFTFIGIPADAAVSVIVSKPGYAHPATYHVFSEEYGFAPGQAGIRIVLVAEARIEGVVVDRDTGKPVSGARLMARPHFSSSIIPIVSPVFCVSAEDGTFSLKGLRAMYHVLQLRPEPVTTPGVVADWAALPVSVSIEEPGQNVGGITFEVTRGAILKTVVTEKATGRPMENVPLMFSRAESPDHLGGAVHGNFQCRTDEGGIGLIRLVAAEYEVNAPGPWLGGRSLPFTFQENQPQELSLQLEAFPCASGELVDSEGNPVAGATLVVLPDGLSHALSDENGHFKISWYYADGDPDGPPKRLLMARHAGLGIAKLIPAAVVDDLRVTLEPAATLVGRVVDSMGKPVVGANVRAVLAPFKPDRNLRDTVPTYATGHYTLRGIPTGHRYTVDAIARGYERDELTVEVGDGVREPLALRDLVLKREGASPSGVAPEREDQPVEGAEVTVEGKGQP